MAGKFSLKPTADPAQRRQILKRGIIGIALVILLAFLLSFFGGGNETASNGTAQQIPPEENRLDARALLEAEPDTPAAPAATPIPANRKFDYEASDSGTLTLPESSETVPSPAENSGNVELAPVIPEPLPADETPAAATVPAQDEAAPAAAVHGKAVLYCGSYPSSQKAEEQKALLAFQGKMSSVTRHNGAYALKLGPFRDRDAARSEFSKLDAAGLVDACSLEDE